MKQLIASILLMACLWWTQSASAASRPYFYPFVNPYVATVMEMPKAFEVKLPEEVPTKEYTLDVFPEREIPDVFWYEDGLTFSLAYQDHKAPLVFVVAGTGSRYNTPRMVKLQKALHQGGFHVITITSPTHMDFVVNASEGLPGDSLRDAKDLYRVMKLAYEKVKPKIEVSSFALTGYSLGAFNAAFISKLDEEQKQFNFKRVLLINPPVNLYDSVTALDKLMVENIPGGPEKFDLWFRGLIAKLAAVSKEMGHTELSGDFIYNAYKRLPPSEENLAAIIGTAFRMSSANMIFTADVMNGGGYIAPKNAKLNNSTSLTPYAMVSYRTRFEDYFNEYLVPYTEKKDPYMNRQALLDRSKLQSIEPYLKSAVKIGLVHNEDDIILMPGEIDYLQGVFGNRARIFPTGGHMGNMFHPDVVRSMIDFLMGKEI